MIFLFLIVSTSALYAEEQEKKDTQQELLDRIETLEKELKKIEDENKARKSLEVTPVEKTEQGKEVLEAVSREYTLSTKGTLSLDYSIGYAYAPTEAFTIQQQLVDATYSLTANRQANHVITHSIYTSYSILDNLTSSMSIPIVYLYDKMGTTSSLSQTDLGDIGFGLGFQAPSSWKWLKLPGDINNTYSLGCSLPTGRSPYKINPKTELSTGSGTYGLSFGSSFNKQVDPVVLFWGVGYSRALPLRNLNYLQGGYTLERIDPGSSYSFNMGMGYALSYATSMNMSFGYGYAKSSTYTYKNIPAPKKRKTSDGTSGSFGLGMGMAITPQTSLSVSLSYSLLSAGFGLSARLPFNFAL
jgi:opacity protein-like surface antigen